MPYIFKGKKKSFLANLSAPVIHGYRYYSTELGRWLNKDPKEEDGGINLYTFALNNSVNLFDRLGLDSIAEDLTNPITWIGIGLVLTWHYLTKDNEDIKDIPKEKTKEKKCCPPCKLIDGTIIPLGTVSYRYDRHPPDVQKHGIFGDHLNLYVANQNPNNCQCFWGRSVTVEPPPHPDWIPMQNFAN